jgi:hypothetical protein
MKWNGRKIGIFVLHLGSEMAELYATVYHTKIDGTRRIILRADEYLAASMIAYL